MPVCSNCKVEKELSEFYRHARDGFSQPCKTCRKAKLAVPDSRRRKNAYQQQWRETEAGRAAQRRAEARTRMRPEYLAQKRAWRATNRQATRAYAAQWNHSDKGRAAQERWKLSGKYEARETFNKYRRDLVRALNLMALEAINGE